jgi:hypothetical protein
MSGKPLYPLQEEPRSILVLFSPDDAYEHFVYSDLATKPRPSPPYAGRCIIASRLQCHSCECGYIVRGLRTVRYPLQSGTALTIGYNNATNVFGISEDRAQLAPGCGASKLVTPGSVQSKLNNYFNAACFTTPPIIGADGIGTAFGDSGSGIVDGPGQFNVDLGIMRNFPMPWPKEGSNLQFRVEFFNLLNHPQFSNPNTTFGSSSFGIISSTAVNPRVGQLALKIIF